MIYNSVRKRERDGGIYNSISLKMMMMEHDEIEHFRSVYATKNDEQLYDDE